MRHIRLLCCSVVVTTLLSTCCPRASPALEHGSSSLSPRPTQHRNTKERTDNNDWDFFMFVQQDPVCYCFFHKVPGGCYYPQNMTALTIHGIWPTKNGTTGPNSCDNSSSFIPSDIQPLLPYLIRDWTNDLRRVDGYYGFWSHEWLKHGTCATGISSMNTEYGFFSTVLSLFAKYNYTSVLEHRGITPSNTTAYNLTAFTSAFVTAYGVTPFVECKYNKQESKQFLLQISLCLKKDLSLMDCPYYIFQYYSHCWKAEPVYYLAVPPYL